jgi:L-2-hydroxyglutarate oxidase LhgO
MEPIDVAIVGGGVVGLACARHIAKRGSSVVVLERERRFGQATSTHNSGVIHAGLYYPPGSLKARLCVRGRDLLYEFCAEHQVPHRRSGKLIVALNDDEVEELVALEANAKANGVEDLAIVDRDAVRAREPHVDAVAAIVSPHTGIVEAEALVRALAETCRDLDVALLPASPLLDASPADDGIELVTPRERIRARQVVNAAGLYADDMSAILGGERFTIYPCRGEYAELAPSKRALVNGPVYPLPHPSGHGLGVHVTTTMWNSVLIGPTIRYQDRKDDYEDGRLPLDAFVEPTRRLLPEITRADLQPGGSGIRAKFCPPDQKFADFYIRRDSLSSAVIQVAGIDSPGLTSCLAIGELVANLAQP